MVLKGNLRHLSLHIMTFLCCLNSHRFCEFDKFPLILLIMKCNEFRRSVPRHNMNLNNLDQALHDLGMLSAITEARREYLKESKSNFGVMRLNTRYVSNVTVGYCMKRTAKNRFCPYVLPIRHRTKSENSDAISEVIDNACEHNSLLDPSTSGNSTLDPKSPAKRCQSLENLNLSTDPPLSPEISPEMDGVSTRIQKLQVDE